MAEPPRKLLLAFLTLLCYRVRSRPAPGIAYAPGMVGDAELFQSVGCSVETSPTNISAASIADRGAVFPCHPWGRLRERHLSRTEVFRLRFDSIKVGSSLIRSADIASPAPSFFAQAPEIHGMFLQGFPRPSLDRASPPPQRFWVKRKFDRVPASGCERPLRCKPG